MLRAQGLNSGNSTHKELTESIIDLFFLDVVQALVFQTSAAPSFGNSCDSRLKTGIYILDTSQFSKLSWGRDLENMDF